MAPRPGEAGEGGGEEEAAEKGEVLLRGVLTLGYLFHLGESSACQVPICTVAAHVLTIQPRK